MPVYNPEPGTCESQEKYYFQNYELLLQPHTPVCYVPPACTLGFTGSTVVTNVTVKGGSDGEIEIGWSGMTGSTVSCYINGALDGTSGTGSYTFTGLIAGYYYILIEEGPCGEVLSDVQVLDGEFRTGPMIVNAPADLTAAENPTIWEIRTATAGAGKKATYTLSIGNGTVSDGDYITFNMTAPYAYSQTFYSKNFPNKSNYFLASALKDSDGNTVGANTQYEIAQSLADALQNDILIPKVYTISYDGQATITLRARENGTKFTLSNNNVTVSGTYLTGTLVQEGENTYDGQQVEGYSIYSEVFENENQLQYPDEGSVNDYERVAELELPFQQSNIHRFDVAPIMKNFVRGSRPVFGATGYTFQPDMLKPYFIRYGEKYPLIQNTSTKKKRYKGQTQVHWVISSSLDHYSTNDMEELGFLGDRLHNVNPNFTAIASNYGSPTSNDSTLTFSNYLYDSADTGTTYSFRVNDTTGSGDHGYQTGATFNLEGYTSYPYPSAGKLYISGQTGAATFVYVRSFYVLPAFHYYSVYGNPSFSEWTGVKFLTNAPDPKLIQRASQEYLYFILQSEYDKQLDVRGDLEFWDGSVQTGVTFFEIQTPDENSAGGVLALNMSYDKLGLDSYEDQGGTIRKIKNATYAVWQTSGTTQYTEDRTYRFEIEDRPRKFGIVFQNKLSGWDAFDFVGIVEQTINRTRGSYTVPISYNSDGSAGQGFKSTASYNTKVTNKVIVNSGWIDEDHFDWLKELMEANDIYSYTTTNQNYLNLETFKYQKSSLDDLYDVEATFIQTIYENAVTV